jgi:signal peptidase I
MLSAVTACQPSDNFSVLMQDSAMEPTYTARSLVRFRSAARAERGEVIAFEYPFPYPGRPRRELIARIVGLPGDQLQLSSAGTVVNGNRIDEPYAKNLATVSPAEISVPTNSYFVLGDARANQRDSRWWGALPAGKLLGVADPTPDPEQQPWNQVSD